MPALSNLCFHSMCAFAQLPSEASHDLNVAAHNCLTQITQLAGSSTFTVMLTPLSYSSTPITAAIEVGNAPVNNTFISITVSP